MQIAACLWSLPQPPRAAAELVADAGFDSIDVDPGFSATGTAALTLPVTCVAVAHQMPAGAALESADTDRRAAAVAHVLSGLDEAVALDARVAYVAPPATDVAAALRAYRHSILGLAGAAADRHIRLGIEHFPGRGLPTVATTLDFVRSTGHPNLYVLLDTGHCQIAGESVVDEVRRLGNRLGYVHVDDNHGETDDHLGLLQGRQTEDDLRRIIAALREYRYGGPIGIETSPRLLDPRRALTDSLGVLRPLVESA